MYPKLVSNSLSAEADLPAIPLECVDCWHALCSQLSFYFYYFPLKPKPRVHSSFV